MFLALSFFLFFSSSEFRSPCGLLSAESGLKAQERGQKGHGNPVILNPLLPQICFVVFEIAARAHRAGFGKGTAPSRPRLSAFYLFIFVILLCPPPRGGISPPFTPFACCDFKDSVPPGLPPISPSFPSPPCVAFFVWRIPSQLWHFPVSRVTSASCIPPYLFGSWLPSLLRAPLAGGWGICSGAEAALTNLPPRPPPVAWRRPAARPLPRPAAAWSAEAGEPRPLGAGLALSGRGGGP